MLQMACKSTDCNWVESTFLHNIVQSLIHFTMLTKTIQRVFKKPNWSSHEQGYIHWIYETLNGILAETVKTKNYKESPTNQLTPSSNTRCWQNDACGKEHTKCTWISLPSSWSQVSCKTSTNTLYIMCDTNCITVTITYRN